MTLGQELHAQAIEAIKARDKIKEDYLKKIDVSADVSVVKANLKDRASLGEFEFSYRTAHLTTDESLALAYRLREDGIGSLFNGSFDESGIRPIATILFSFRSCYKDWREA